MTTKAPPSPASLLPPPLPALLSLGMTSQHLPISQCAPQLLGLCLCGSFCPKCLLPPQVQVQRILLCASPPCLPQTNSQFSSLCLRSSRHRLSTVPLSTTVLSLPEILQARGWSFSFCCLTYQRPRIKPFTGVPHFSKVRFMPLHFCERPRWHPFSLTERNPKWIFCFYKKR